MFQQTVSAAFTGVTYLEPATTTANEVTGLAPSSGYTVTKTPAGGSIQVSIQTGGTTVTDSAGVLSF